MIFPVPSAEESFAALRRLRVVATGIVAVALLAAGGWKLFRPDPSVTMMSRYLQSPRATRAGGCLEIALALWLISGRSPKLAPVTAAGALVGLSILIGSEIQRDAPLPCGCFPTRANPQGASAVRYELSVALGRNAFLVVLCGVAVWLDPSDEPEMPRPAFDRLA